MDKKNKEEQLSLFGVVKDGVVAVVFAYNRGHASTLLGKEFKSRGLEFSTKDPITKLEPGDNKKGKVIILSEDKVITQNKVVL